MSSEVESQIVGWLNEIGFASASDKMSLLRKIIELMLHQGLEFLPKYLHDVLSISADRNQDIRKCIIAFVEDICQVKIELLPKMIIQFRMMLMDGAVLVQKRAIQAANIIFRNAFMWICNSDHITQDMESTWELLNDLKLHILNMVDSDNEGIRTNSVKFLQGIVVLQTYADDSIPKKDGDFSLDDVPLNLKFTKRKKLEDEAHQIFNLLLKYHNSQHISCVNLMGCMAAVCEVAKTRPSFMPRVVEALCELNSTLPPTLTQSQVNSVRKHLKLEIFNLIRHPASNDVLPQLVQLLSDLGVTNQELSKVIPKGKRNKRLQDLRIGESATKRMRVDSPSNDSQGSEKSGVSSVQDAVGDDLTSEPKFNHVTEVTVLNGLQNIESVINLVADTMKNLPDEMPGHFAAMYEPIAKTGNILQKDMLAKLLLTIIKSDPTETEVASVAPKDDNAGLKSALSKIESKKLEKKIESAVSKLMEENKMDDLEAVREKMLLKTAEKEKQPPCPPTPSIPKLKQRAKTIKLHEVTKPLPNDMKERLMVGAVERILKAERAGREGGAAIQREKSLTIFAVSYGPQVREVILSYILEDIASQIDLALAWLYEEYSQLQGFSQSFAASMQSRTGEKFAQNYNNLMCALVTNISDLSEPSQEILQESLMRRLYLEAPMVTEDAMMFLKHICTEDGKTISGLNLLRDMILFHPPKAPKYVSIILPLTLHETSTVREAAIEQVIALYRLPHESLKKSIEKHASLYLGFIAMPIPPRDLFDFESGRLGNASTWNDDLYKMCLQLYLALLPLNEELISELWRVYAVAGADAKRCVLRLIDGPVRQLGPDSTALLTLVEACPKGAETLVTRVIYILTEKAPPTPELVSRVRELYANRVSDVRFLIPVINGLTKDEVMAALPKLIKLNPAVVKEAFNKILSQPSDSDFSPTVTPAELLVALHYIDPAKADLKYVIKATSLCFADKQAYTHEVLGSVLQQLVDMPELPVLLMRSVLQSLTLHPTRLASLVINILQVLVSREVWEHKVVWEGFVKCCQRLSPQSVPVVLSLPPSVLRPTLQACPDLLEVLLQVTPTMPSCPPHVRQVVDDCQALRSLPGGDKTSDIDSIMEPLPPGMD